MRHSIALKWAAELGERLRLSEVEMQAIFNRIERMGSMSIEINNRTVGSCNYHDDRGCRLKRERSYDRITVCSDCPKWTQEDVLYEHITGHVVEHTYEWWYKEWVEGYDDGLAVPYAFERMLRYVTTTTLTPPEIQARVVKKHHPDYFWIWDRGGIEISSTVRGLKPQLVVISLGLFTLIGLLAVLQVLFGW
jgi:hypothetical protein